MEFEPSYIQSYKKGNLLDAVEKSWKILEECILCPRECRVNRLKGETGYCRTDATALVSSVGPHFGEEQELVGRGGSGTIFFANCTLSCVFCQNYDISQLGHGRKVDTNELAESMLYLQSIGCHNINFVTPTHVVPQILKSLIPAIEGELNIPLVYNCGGYESVQTLKLFEGIIDIYMPDAKYGEEKEAKKYSNVENYPEVNRSALKEMHSQVGDLIVKDGIAEKGLLIRHLILPYNLAGSFKVLEFIAKLSKNSFVNIMDQYRPFYIAHDYFLLQRRITHDEYTQVTEYAKKLGLKRGF